MFVRTESLNISWLSSSGCVANVIFFISVAMIAFLTISFVRDLFLSSKPLNHSAKGLKIKERIGLLKVKFPLFKNSLRLVAIGILALVSVQAFDQKLTPEEIQQIKLSNEFNQLNKVDKKALLWYFDKEIKANGGVDKYALKRILLRPDATFTMSIAEYIDLKNGNCGCGSTFDPEKVKSLTTKLFK